MFEAFAKNSMKTYLLGLDLLGLTSTAQKIKFSIKDFFSICEEPVDLVTFTGEVLHGKLHFFCSEGSTKLLN